MADRVAGQSDFTTNTTHCFSGLDVDDLCLPYGLALDSGGRLFVSDKNNKRILSWPATFTNGSLPDLTLTSDGHSALEIGATSTVSDSSGRLFAIDNQNNRIIIYNADGGWVADHVIGQQNWDSGLSNQPSGLPTANNLSGPYSAALTSTGYLFVADMLNNRVLGYADPLSTTFNVTATLVLGQPDFVHNSRDHNPGGTGPSAHGMYHPQGVTVDNAGRLYVADSGNHRVLRFSPPFSTGMASDRVLGQADFTGNAPNRGLADPSAYTLDSPIGVAADNAGHLYVADTNNLRVLGYPVASGSGGPAVIVFGQPDFGPAYYGETEPPHEDSLAAPYGVAVDSAGNLYVADTYNNRAVEYYGPFIREYYMPVISKY